MGLVKTFVYWPKVQVPQLDLDGLEAYSLAWRKVLAHPDVRVLKSVEGNDVLIVEHPVYIPAASAFGVVIPITWSKLNPDFTDESQTIVLPDMKARIKPVVADLIVPQYFPDLVGVKYGVNVWLQRLDGGFVMI